MRRALLCSVAIGLLACGPPVARSAQSGASASRVATPSPPPSSPTPSPPAPVEVLWLTDGSGGLTVHLLAISGQSVVDRPLLERQAVRVLDANRRVALIEINHYTQLATLDIATGTVRPLRVTDAGGGMWAALSPDGTQAAVKIEEADLKHFDIVIVDLRSGAVRRLLQTAWAQYAHAGLDPIRWSAAGILVSPGVWDCYRVGLSRLDPNTGSLAPVSGEPVGVFSPDGGWMATSSYTNLGDRAYEGQCGWANRLTAGPLGPSPTVIAQQKNRDFSALDVTNDGSLLYLADDAALSQAKPATDMGIYFEADGQKVQELNEIRVGQWNSGVIVSPESALVAKVVHWGDPATVEVDLVGLCTRAGCTPTVQAVGTVSGGYPYSRLMLLRDVPAV
jgi:hypothetical protein